jgi:CRP-like cAMP-binding protein
MDTTVCTRNITYPCGCTCATLQTTTTTTTKCTAIDLISRLMDVDASTRMSANELLDHPWTRGITARTSKMVDAGKKLAMHKDYRSGISRKVMENLVRWTDETDAMVVQRISLVERSFRGFDRQQKGFLTAEDFSEDGSTKDPSKDGTDTTSEHMSLSDFSDVLAENLVNKFFPKGTVVYQEGDRGDSMYFINSGSISVTTTAGSSATRSPGDCFGEGAMFHPHKLRSATVTCETPVHAIEISREYFEKYLTKSDLVLSLLEKDKIRKRNRAKMILRMQKDLRERIAEPGEVIFQKGEPGDTMYLVQKGNVVITENGIYVFTATPSNVFGEYSVVTGRPRNSTAVCSDGCIIQELDGVRFRSLASSYADIYSSMHDLCLRRDFKKAVVLRLQSEFPYNNPRKAFDAILQGQETTNSQQYLDFTAVASLMRGLNDDYTG